MSPPTPDPFGTEALRSSVLRAWRDSPTRFTEDTNVEHDLRAGAYRDRLSVELAQNAADAAALAGTPGVLRVSVVDNELRVANTGAPLDAAGVASLASLRASAKLGDTVGRFGVGFAAVLTVSGEPRVVSRTGGVVFSETRTREAAEREGDVPVLRLPWPMSEDEPVVPQGFDTEVRLPLADGIDAAALLARFAEEAEDLLLALPWLARIEVGDVTLTRSEVDSRWLTHAGPDGCVWALPANGKPLVSDVLHAPTPTDEGLSLPARLIASLPIEPSRRRVLPGPEVRAVLDAAAEAYPGLARKVPAEQRLNLVPRAGFPRSDVDSELRELVFARLRAAEWLPAADGTEVPGARARVLGVDSPRLVELLADLVPGLVAAPLCGPEPAKVLAAVGADQIGAAEFVEAITGIERDPSWWRSLYDTLLPLLEAHSVTEDDLGGLPVPLTDGRTLPGPRGALLFEVSDESTVDVIGLRLVHPEAAHPLLERLGAKHADARDLLEAPALVDAVERSVDDALSGLDTEPLVDFVLRLVSATGAEGLGGLALPTEYSWRRADELILPTSPLLEIFDRQAVGEEGTLGILDHEFAARWPVEVLTAVGVLDTFAVETYEDDELEIRDLDLVADDAWPDALRLLAARPETWRALNAAGPWLSRHSLLAGRAPTEWRLPDADGLAGLYDPVPDLGLRPELLTIAGVRAELRVADADDAADLVDRLGDPDRAVAPGLISRAYTALADAELDWDDVEAPATVRTIDGSVVDADRAAVLDQPWLVAVWPADRLVAAAPGVERASTLAELLDLPLLSERISARISDDGEYLAWSELTAIRVVAELLDLELPDGGVIVHEQLTVEVDGVKHDAPWWCDRFHGEHHAEDSPAGLARAFAWAADRWPDRHLITALLEDPDPATLLN